jgi:hypothetical protein
MTSATPIVRKDPTKRFNDCVDSMAGEVEDCSRIIRKLALNARLPAGVRNGLLLVADNLRHTSESYVDALEDLVEAQSAKKEKKGNSIVKVGPIAQAAGMSRVP